MWNLTVETWNLIYRHETRGCNKIELVNQYMIWPSELVQILVFQHPPSNTNMINDTQALISKTTKRLITSESTSLVVCFKNRHDYTLSEINYHIRLPWLVNCLPKQITTQIHPKQTQTNHCFWICKLNQHMHREMQNGKLSRSNIYKSVLQSTTVIFNSHVGSIGQR